jgi:hypothetical protein
MDNMKEDFKKVSNELDDLGLLAPGISLTLVNFKIWQGEYQKSRSSIVLPAISVTNLLRLASVTKLGQTLIDAFDIVMPSAITNADVIRHEFGHAYLEWRLKEQSFKRQFNQIFQEGDYDEEKYICEYAAFDPGNDFAECFLFYTKWNGDFEERNISEIVKQKLRFIRDTRKAV